MAGVKGKSGGPRKNAGGARPGAGRKRKAKTEKSANTPPAESVPVDPLAQAVKREPLEFLELVMNNPLAPLKDRIRAGVAAAQYRHMKRGDGGKKDEQADKAKKAATGKFAPTAPPKLVVNNQ
jgi:hypothetical protein